MSRPLKSRRLHDVAVEAMREECKRQIEQARGCVKAAAINLGYDEPRSFYATLHRLGVVLNSHRKPHKSGE